MAFKFFTLFTGLAILAVGYIQAATIAQPLLEKSDLDDPHPQYSFNYDVQDAVSGDYKSQYESRDGDFVQGQYTLNEPDGYKRIVDYTADAEHGFNAVVRRELLGAAPAVAVKTVEQAPAATFFKSAAPTLVKTLQPAVYTSPTLVHSAPAPTLVRSASSPTLVKTLQPAVYTSPTLVHSAPAPTLVRSAPSPTLVKTLQPAVYTSPTLVHSAPAATLVQQAPSATFYHSAPTLLRTAPTLVHSAVKTSFASPLISYAY